MKIKKETAIQALLVIAIMAVFLFSPYSYDNRKGLGDVTEGVRILTPDHEAKDLELYFMYDILYVDYRSLEVRSEIGISASFDSYQELVEFLSDYSAYQVPLGGEMENKLAYTVNQLEYIKRYRRFFDMEDYLMVTNGMTEEVERLRGTGNFNNQ